MNHKADDGNQVDRFKQMARELGCAEDEAAFDQALRKVTQAKPLPKREPRKRRESQNRQEREGH